MSTSAISHLVIVPSDSKEQQTTYFQGYSAFWAPDLLRVLKCLVYFPHDVSDIYLSGEEFSGARTIGASLEVNFLRGDLLENYLELQTKPFMVIWSSAETVETVENAISKLISKPLHITTATREGVILLDELDEDHINRLVAKMFADESSTDSTLNEFRLFLEKKDIRKHNDPKLQFKAKRHNCTEPLLDLLTKFGAKIEVTGIKPSKTTDEHITSMLYLAAIIDDYRPKAFLNSPLRKNDAIIYCPSVYTYLYRADSKHWRDLNRLLSNPKRNFVRSALIRNRGYGNFSQTVADSDVFNPYEDKFVGPLLRDRQIELVIFTTAISIVACNQFVPAFRLPNSVMLHHDKLRDIGACANTNDRNRHKNLSSKLSAYSRVITEEIGDELLTAMFGDRVKILAVCDFPIEWISFDLLPAMFRYELSRIPSTPGNVTNSVLLSIPKHAYTHKALCDILIIRSFEESDEIKDHLSEVVQWGHEEGRLKGLNVRLVDVESKKELIDALNSFQGLMVIFDCHGGHGGEQDSAWLHIGNENVDVWHIYQSARVPPIIILAACSTHPVEGSHASVANGFLESGACSVLGTFAPIDSSFAAAFVYRLLTRIAIYLPFALKSRSYTWREFISGLFKESYIKDVLKYLRYQKGLLTATQTEKIQNKTNLLINIYETNDWFDSFRQILAKELGVDDSSIDQLFLENFQFVDTMLMVQLGRPENIVINPD